MTQRPHSSTFTRPAKRRGVLTRISAQASKHKLSVGPFRGHAVGALESAVLEDSVDVIKGLLETVLTSSADRKALEADLRAVNEERERRWLAFSS
jgi:hypothetical protein